MQEETAAVSNLHHGSGRDVEPSAVGHGALLYVEWRARGWGIRLGSGVNAESVARHSPALAETRPTPGTLGN